MPDIFAAASVEIYFQYTPSLALGTVALLLFSAITLVLAAQTFVYRRRCKFMWVVVVTGGMEVAGYTSHMVAAETVNSTAYVAFHVLTVLAPNFLALVNYVVVGKVAEQQQLQGQYLSARSIAGTFFVIDWICIAVQGVGSGILASALQSPGSAVQRTVILGQTVLVVGLAIQLAFFATFTLVAGYVYRKQRGSEGWKAANQVFICLFVTIGLITMRNIYRCIELGVGWNGYLNKHEKYFYSLDAAPMFAAFCVYSGLHFGRYMQDTSKLDSTRPSSTTLAPAVAAKASVLDSCTSIDHLVPVRSEFWLTERDCIEAKGIQDQIV